MQLLRRRRRALHAEPALRRIGELHRQTAEHGREAVRTALITESPFRGGNDGDERPLRQLPPNAQVATEQAGRHAKHDVVHREAERPTHALTSASETRAKAATRRPAVPLAAGVSIRLEHEHAQH